MKYEKYGWFVPVYFFQAVVNEIESPLTKIEEGFGRARAEYTPINNKKRKYLPYLNVDLGVEIPVWSMKLPKDWSIAVDFPVDFHLWLDLQTLYAPVIDTDYRFAVGQIKALKIFHDKYINNLSIRLAPYNHESTHIGDELTIRRKDAGYPITRVNVSYEYTELAVCLNDPVGSRLENHALKAGMMLRMPLGSNWFKIYTNEDDPSFEVKMKNSMEYYLEYEWQRSNGLLTWNNINNILSVEIRNRAKYKYPSIMWNENK